MNLNLSSNTNSFLHSFQFDPSHIHRTYLACHSRVQFSKSSLGVYPRQSFYIYQALMAPTFSVSINLGCCVKTVSASFIWPYFGTSPSSAERWRLLNEYCFLNFRRWFCQLSSWSPGTPWTPAHSGQTWPASPSSLTWKVKISNSNWRERERIKIKAKLKMPMTLSRSSLLCDEWRLFFVFFQFRVHIWFLPLLCDPRGQGSQTRPQRLAARYDEGYLLRGWSRDCTQSTAGISQGCCLYIWIFCDDW